MVALRWPIFGYGISFALLIGFWWPSARWRSLSLGVGIGIGLLLCWGSTSLKEAFTGPSQNTITDQIAQVLVLKDARSRQKLEDIQSLPLASIFLNRSSSFLFVAALLRFSLSADPPIRTHRMLTVLLSQRQSASRPDA
jgi:hypothetical protein